MAAATEELPRAALVTEQGDTLHFADDGALELYHGTTSECVSGILRGGLHDPCLTHSLDLAEYYAEEAVAERGGAPVILTVRADPARLRHDYAAMDEPVSFDGHSSAELEETVRRVWRRAAREHPEWVRGGCISIPPEEYARSLCAVASCRHEGVVPAPQVSQQE